MNSGKMKVEKLGSTRKVNYVDVPQSHKITKSTSTNRLWSFFFVRNWCLRASVAKKRYLGTALKFLVFFVLLPSLSFAKGTVKISGFEPAYKGYHIEFYRFEDPISREKTVLASFKIEDDGSFSTSFELNGTTFCMTDFDAYNASLFLVPGNSYELIFPPQKKVTDSQKRSPFFKPEEISFALKNSQPRELNRRVQDFEMAYSEEENRRFNQIYHQKSKAAVDSLKVRLSVLFPKTDDAFFEGYKFYRLAFAEFALHQGKSFDYVKRYFINQKPNLDIPPCAQLFEQLFSNYFLFESNKVQGADFKAIVGRSDLKGIENYLITKNGWDSNLARLVILQSVKDAYFEGHFSQAGLLRLLDQAASGNWEQDKKEIAKRLKTKLTYLQPGSRIPDFTMTAFSGEKHQLREFQGKYIYLIFSRVANPIGRQHLDELKKIAPVYKNDLQVVNLILPEETGRKEAILQQGWAGNFYVVDEKTADTFRVKNFPTAYLVDSKGMLVWSPAPNPLDGFEQQLINLLKQKRREDQRPNAVEGS